MYYIMQIEKERKRDIKKQDKNDDRQKDKNYITTPIQQLTYNIRVIQTPSNHFKQINKQTTETQ